MLFKLSFEQNIFKFIFRKNYYNFIFKIKLKIFFNISKK